MRCWFPGDDKPVTYEKGGKMPHSGASVVVQAIELTPTGGVIVSASGGLLKLVANVPMEMDLSGVTERKEGGGEND